MKFLRLVSDIHLDFDQGRRPPQLWLPQDLPEDRETCLVIPGDLWRDGRSYRALHDHATGQVSHDGASWLELVSKKFKYAVLVLGNHDYWGRNIDTEPAELRRALADRGITNVHLLENSLVVLDGVKFVGGTLWTNFNEQDPQVMLWHRDVMQNDVKGIRRGKTYIPVSAQDLYHRHSTTANYIFKNAKRDEPGQRVVVVTHMAPSYQSINEVYRTPAQRVPNYYYFSDLENRIFNNGDGEIDLWFHGHTHKPADYTIGNTRVVCNPRGYAGYERTGYDPTWRLDLETMT